MKEAVLSWSFAYSVSYCLGKTGEKRVEMGGNAVLQFHIYLTYTWLELERIGQRCKMRREDTNRFRGDRGLGHWINHTSDSSDQRCCQTRSLLCLPEEGRAASELQHCQHPKVNSSACSLEWLDISGPLLTPSCLWSCFGFLFSMHLLILSQKQEKKTPWGLTPGLSVIGVVTFTFADFPYSNIYCASGANLPALPGSVPPPGVSPDEKMRIW